jgi:hypothetical protein
LCNFARLAEHTPVLRCGGQQAELPVAMAAIYEHRWAFPGLQCTRHAHELAEGRQWLRPFRALCLEACRTQMQKARALYRAPSSMLIDLRNCHVRCKWEHYLSPGAMASAPSAESYCTAQPKSHTQLKVNYYIKQVPAALSRRLPTNLYFLWHPFFLFSLLVK